MDKGKLYQQDDKANKGAAAYGIFIHAALLEVAAKEAAKAAFTCDGHPSLPPMLLVSRPCLGPSSCPRNGLWTTFGHFFLFLGLHSNTKVTGTSSSLLCPKILTSHSGYYVYHQAS